MDVKEEQRVAIKFSLKVDFSTTKTVELIQKAYGEAALSRTTIFEWHKRFRIRRVRPALYRTRDFFPPARQRPGAFGSKNSTVSDSKTSRNVGPPPIFAKFSPPDYSLFPKVKLQLKGARFDTIEEIQKAVTDQRRRLF